MKTIFDLQTGVVTLLCTAALAGLTACEADPVMQESGKLPDKGSIEEVHVMLCSSNSVENRVDVLLTEGGVMTKNFYLRQTQPAAAGYSLDAWCDASLLNDYDAGDEIERTLLPEANYEFPDGKTLDLSAATQRSELKRIKFSASGLAAGEYVLPLTVAAQDAPDADKTLYYNVSVRQPYTDEYTLHDGHDLFFVFYVNTNDFQPLLAQDYIMRKKVARGTTVAWYGTVGNIVNLRTVQVGYDAAAGRALLDLGTDMTYVLSQSTKYIRPLQEHGRKVCISIEGGGKGLGFCNLTDAQIEDFAAQVKTVIEQYELDGVNLWDRNSGYGKEGMPAVNTTSYPKLIKALREALGTEKLLTVTVYEEPTATFWDTEATGGIAVGDYIDYAWSGYNSNSEAPQLLDPWHPELEYVSTYTQKPIAKLPAGKLITLFQYNIGYNQINATAGAKLDHVYSNFGYNTYISTSGVTKERYAPLSINLGSIGSNVSYYGDRAYDLTEAGYGGIMHFNLRTRTDSDPLSLFNSIADGAWEETVTCENGNRPQDWTFVSSGYTITYDEATAE